MMKLFNKILNVTGIVLAGSFMSVCLMSCKGDNALDPVAYFTYVTDGLSVSFTDGSLDADTHSWDFGDGSTSDEQNPSHTYASEGSYTVTLSVCGKGGDDSASKTVSLTAPGKITIDGDFSDWDQISAEVTCDEGAAATALEALKIYSDANSIYFYVKMAAGNTGGIIDIMLDADFDSSTGEHSWMWDAGSGIDYLIEGAIFTDKDAPMYKFTGADGSSDWSWEEAVSAGSSLINAADPKTTGDYTEFEFSIPKELIPNLSSDGIGVGMNLMDANWSSIGILPSVEGDYTTANYNFAKETLTITAE